MRLKALRQWCEKGGKITACTVGLSVGRRNVKHSCETDGLEVPVYAPPSWCHRTEVCIVRASLHMRREENPSRCHSMLYCTYDMLNMFRALVCPSSGARDYMCVIAAYSVQCLTAGCRGSGAGQQGVRPERGMLHVVQHPSSWTHTLLPCT